MNAIQKSLLALGIASASLLAIAASDVPPSAGSNRSPAASQASAPGPTGGAETPTMEEIFASPTDVQSAEGLDETGNGSGVPDATSVATSDAHHWDISVMPEAGSFYHALVFDPQSGNPAIAFSAGGYAKLARWNGTAWAITSVGSGGTGVDLAFDPVDRNPSVSWGATKLVFAHWTGAAWKLETVEKTNATNDVTSLAYAPDGTPAIAYRYTGGKGSTRFARKSGSSWVIQVVDSAYGGGYYSLAFDPAGRPAIAYAVDADRNGSYDTLKLARWNGAAWKTVVVETGVVGYGVFASLAFDASGNPVIAHGSGTIRYVQWDGSSWVVEPIASGNAGSLAYDPAGPLVSYYVGYKEVRIARRVGPGTWTTELVETVSSSWKTDLVLDPQGFPSFSYRRNVGTTYSDFRIGLARWVEE
jgi:hypothetical protein